MQDLSVDLSILIQRIEVSLASLIQVYNLVFIITKLVPPSGRTTFNVAVLSVSLIVTAMFVVEFFEVEPHMYYLNNINADVMFSVLIKFSQTYNFLLTVACASCFLLIHTKLLKALGVSEYSRAWDVVFYVCWTIVFGLFLVSTQLASLFPLRSLIQIVLSVVVGGTLLVYTTILFRRLNRLRAALSGSMTLLSPHNLRDTTVSSNSELRRERIGLCLLVSRLLYLQAFLWFLFTILLGMGFCLQSTVPNMSVAFGRMGVYIPPTFELILLNIIYIVVPSKAIVEVPDPKSSVGSAEIKVLTKSASILLATRENGCVTDRGSLPRSRTDLSPTRAKSESA